MRKFNVSVNGKTYEVEVEEAGSQSGSVVSQVAPAPRAQAPKVAAAPAPKAAPTPKVEEVTSKVAEPVKKEAAVDSVGGLTISCPMPGTILAVNVKVGDTVKRGDILFILEAMKMENEIMTDRDGKVTSVGVSKGASVDTGDLLATIE